MIENELEQRPVIVAIAGSNGAGKSTFYPTYLQKTNLRFINADVIAKRREIDAYAFGRGASGDSCHAASQAISLFAPSSSFVSLSPQSAPTSIHAHTLLSQR